MLFLGGKSLAKGKRLARLAADRAVLRFVNGLQMVMDGGMTAVGDTPKDRVLKDGKLEVLRYRPRDPEEVEIGPDEQAFMELLVSKTVGILETEPIDVYVNPTFLPAVIAAKYDALWTEERMGRVIDAAVKSGVAIEINARYKLPSERFLRLAKAKGAKFTFGTNNAGASDLGDWSYPLAMQKALDLKWQDMFVPGHQPSRAQRE